MNDPKILIPLIRKVMPALIAQDIVGVQPMGPRPKREQTWQEYLIQLQLRYSSWTKLGQECEGDGLAEATEMMQAKYPGPYRLTEKYNADRGTFDLKLEFDDPKQETMWLIKYS